MASAQGIVKAILSSELSNEDLQVIRQGLERKQKLIARMMIRTLRKGDRVEIMAGRPKYLNGVTATVEETKYNKVEILIDEGFDTGRFGRRILCPVACLRVIHDSVSSNGDSA